MLSRVTVTMCGSKAVVVGGKWRFFVRETSRSLAFYFSPWFFLSRRNYCNLFCDFGSLGVGERPAAMAFLLPVIVVRLGHRVEYQVLLMVRHCRRCLVKSQGGCYFGLFNNDSYVSFRAFGLLWG